MQTTLWYACPHLVLYFSPDAARGSGGEADGKPGGAGKASGQRRVMQLKQMQQQEQQQAQYQEQQPVDGSKREQGQEREHGGRKRRDQAAAAAAPYFAYVADIQREVLVKAPLNASALAAEQAAAAVSRDGDGRRCWPVRKRRPCSS